jgi:hypothetical protein
MSRADDRYPHVTDILRDSGLVDAQWFTDAARDRGTATHLAAQYHDEGRLDRDSIAPEWAGQLAAYELFLKEQRAEVLEVEQFTMNNLHRYCGTYDRVLALPGRSPHFMVDIKNGGTSPWHRIQLAAYVNSRSLVEQGYTKRANLYLKPNGRYQWVEYDRTTDRRDFNVFLAALTVANWRKARG